jgi:predicted glycoside hydrolase/deacetylase ChbG (UPF0249 family)
LNADDFGLTSGINRSVIELHRAGALSSATLMATAPHFTSAAAAAANNPGLGVGCHIVLVDGEPALPATGEATLPTTGVPSLAPHGSFYSSLAAFAFHLAAGRISQAEIELEAVAQIRRLQSAGVKVTHLDTHKHTHMFRSVLRPLLRAARSCGVPAIRNPFEPAWARRAAVHAAGQAPLTRRIEVALLATRRAGFLHEVERAGLATTAGAISVLSTGTLDRVALGNLLRAIPPGPDTLSHETARTDTWELICHPGYRDADLDKVRTRLRESRAVEHAALLQQVPSFLKAHPETELIHYGDLARP